MEGTVPSASGSSSATYPRWVTLKRHYQSNIIDSFPPTGVTDRTLAAAITSDGYPIQVSLRLFDPPAASALCVQLPHDVGLKYSTVIAAHSDSLLVAVKFNLCYQTTPTTDYFVYNAGDAAAVPPRPPSLLLLPRYHHPEPTPSLIQHRRMSPDFTPALAVGDDPVKRKLDAGCTGILRPHRGDDDGGGEVVVAELKIVEVSKGTKKTMVGELFLFRSGKWSVMRSWVCCGMDNEFGELHPEWKTTGVFPVGDRILCWADEASGNGGGRGGVLICDVLQESPYLQYVPLPSVPTACFGKKLCAANGGGGTLKFVGIFPRCCCGGVGVVSDCQRSRHAYTIKTWMLGMDMDGGMMEWVMDATVDATELWSLDAYKGLPRIPLGFPVMSMYDPHIIWFSLCESYHVEKKGGDPTRWLLMVDMRSKTIQSVSRLPDYCWLPGDVLVFSNVSDYLNPDPTCRREGTWMDQSSLISEMDSSDGEKKKRHGDGGMNSMLRSPCKMSTSTEPAAKASEILAAFQEIPSYGLDRDDMLKVYAVLSSDNGRRVRSLLRLPMKLRKNWLLKEIKATRIHWS